MVVAFTEAGGSKAPNRYVRPELMARANAGGWHLNVNRSDGAVAVNPLRLTPTADRYEHVLDATGGRGAHSNRGTVVSAGVTPAGNTVSLLTTHLLRPIAGRWDDIDAQLDSIEQVAAQVGSESDLVFLAADVNAPDAPGVGDNHVWKRLDGMGFVTCWDDAGRYPDSHGRGGAPIDTICRNRGDARVGFVEAVNGPLRHSDHQWTRARYTVADLAATPPCTAVLTIAGEHYRCDWPTDRHGKHPGFAHASAAAEALWATDPAKLRKAWASAKRSGR